MTDMNEWQGRVGQSWASEWSRTDRSFAALTEELTRRLGEMEYSSVLDVGCGAGELSCIAARLRPEALVLGLDISPDLIEVARERGSDLPNLSFALGDAAHWRCGPEVERDLLISRHGVMFFADPVAAFANLRAACASDAQLMFSCFGPVAENPFFLEIGRLLPPSEGPALDPYAPGPFAFADSERVARILTEAGWSDLAFERFNFRMIAGAGDDPVSDAIGYFTRIGPAARALAEMDEAGRQQMRARLEEFLPQHVHDGMVSMGASVWIVTGRNA